MPHPAGPVVPAHIEMRVMPLWVYRPAPLVFREGDAEGAAQEMSSRNGPLLTPNVNRVPTMSFSERSKYSETREPWPVRYEADGVQHSGTVVGFSDMGWHIVGDTPVQPGVRVTLRVQLPHRPGLFCVPPAIVQTAEGRSFVIRVQLQAAS